MTDPMQKLSQLLSDLPARLAEAQEQAAELTARQFVAASTDGAVTATVDGSGQLVEVRLSGALARRMGSLAIGERVAQAVNRALDDAEAERTELVRRLAPAIDLTGAEDVFGYRMDELERTLDSLLSRLPRPAE